MNIGTTWVWMPSKKRTVKGRKTCLLSITWKICTCHLLLLLLWIIASLTVLESIWNTLSLQHNTASIIALFKVNQISRPWFYFALFSAWYCKISIKYIRVITWFSSEWACNQFTCYSYSGVMMILHCYSLFLSFSENKFANVQRSYI